MGDHDPLSQFFPDDPDVNLYEVLSLTPKATASEIKSAYRRLALRYHPDKHVNSSPEAQKDASARFQQVGFAYAVLGDEKRKVRYDNTGKTDEGMDWEGKGADGWEAYFEEMFEKVTRGKLDEMKKEYQGSGEETADLCSAYTETGGSIEDIITRIPHSNHTDEARFTKVINGLIEEGKLEAIPAWSQGLKNEKARATRKRKGEKEACEAEGLAKELGVWDEFYGSGKEGARLRKGTKKGKTMGGDGGRDADGEEALKALIQTRQKKMGSFFDSLAAKYVAEPERKSRGNGKSKKRAQEDEEEEMDVDESSRKKAKTPVEPDIDDEEFSRIQQMLMARKAEQKTTTKGGRTYRAK